MEIETTGHLAGGFSLVPTLATASRPTWVRQDQARAVAGIARLGAVIGQGKAPNQDRKAPFRMQISGRKDATGSVKYAKILNRIWIPTGMATQSPEINGGFVRISLLGNTLRIVPNNNRSSCPMARELLNSTVGIVYPYLENVRKLFSRRMT